MQEHIERWQYPKDIKTWKDEIDVLKEFARERPCYMADHIVSFFNLATFDFDCEEIETASGEISIYPNPNNGNFTISNQTFEKIEEAKISIFNFDGQVIFKENDISVEKNEDFHINVKGLPFGIYFLILENEDHSIRERFIISSN